MKTYKEAYDVLMKKNDKSNNFIQWKGTDVCMDFYCECGCHNHYDAYFAYVIECKHCKQKYALGFNVETIKIDESIDFEPIQDDSDRIDFWKSKENIIDEKINNILDQN